MLEPYGAVRVVARLAGGTDTPQPNEPEARAEMEQLEALFLGIARERGMTWQDIAFGLGLGSTCCPPALRTARSPHRRLNTCHNERVGALLTPRSRIYDDAYSRSNPDRREITSALVRALERRHEVLDAVVDSKDHQEALTTVAELLGTSEANAEAVLSLKFSALTKAARDRIQGELENLDATLEWTTLDRPASSGQNFTLRPFSDSAEDKSLFTIRSGEQLAKTASRGARIGSKLSASVAPAGSTTRPLPEVNVAIWIAPESRKKGYGTACVKHSRRELAAEFPGTVLVVRACVAGTSPVSG
ncbi:unnamed protein product, partial [Mesorhabditis spiculigera]